MNDRLSRWVAGWLAHPSGVLQALTTTAAWLAVPIAFHWRLTTAIFWYLAYCTFISFATQFTLAYQNQKAERALALTLRNQADTMRLLLQLAERDVHTGEELQAQVERMVAVTTDARGLLEKLAVRNRTIIEAALDAATKP